MLYFLPYLFRQYQCIDNSFTVPTFNDKNKCLNQYNKLIKTRNFFLQMDAKKVNEFECKYEIKYNISSFHSLKFLQYINNTSSFYWFMIL